MDLQKFNKKRTEAAAQSKSSGKKDRTEFFRIKDPGFYAQYLCAPNAEMDDFLWIRVVMHYKVGPEGKMHVCLDKTNEAVWSEPVQRAIQKRNDRIRDQHPDWVVEMDEEAGCPTCDEVSNPDSTYDERELKDMSAKEQWLCATVPWWYMPLTGGNRIETSQAERVPRPWFCSSKIQEEIAGLISSNALDITDPQAGVLVQVKRVGKTFKDTRYTVSLDVTTAKTPLKMPPPIRTLLRELEPDGENSLHVLIANLVRPYDQIVGWLTGVPATTSTQTDDDPEGPPACFKKECTPEDDYCRGCAWKVECAEACGTDVPPAVGTQSEPEKAATKPQEARQTETQRRGPGRPPKAAEGKPGAGNGQSRQQAKEPDPEPSDNGDPLDDFERELELARNQ